MKNRRKTTAWNLLAGACAGLTGLLIVACSERGAPPASPYAGEAHRLPVLSESDKSRLLDVAERAIDDFIKGRDGFEPLDTFAGVPNRAVRDRRGVALRAGSRHHDG